MLLEAGSDKDAIDIYVCLSLRESPALLPNTPFHFAAFAGNFLIVEHLLVIGVDLRCRTIDRVPFLFSEDADRLRH
jgi:ankyrin repeat protein